jgi:two-component system, NarL family, sensor histidine kinase UhpB
MSQINTILPVLGRYGVSLAVVIGSILINPYLTTRFDASGLFIILAAILFSAWYGGLGPGLFTTSVGTLGIAYHLMEPRGSIAIDSADQVLRLILFVVTSLVVVFFASSRQAALRRLAQANEGLSRLTERLNIVREEERARLSSEIHDQLGGLLVLLKIYVVAVKRKIKDDNTIEDQTNAILKQLDESIGMVQRVAMELRPSVLDHVGLPAAIDAYLDANCPRVELDCKKDIDSEVQLESACGTALFRILQEAFTNIIRHAHAKGIIVRLKQNGSDTTLSVSDNGIGLEQGQILQPSGLGLMGMRERIRSFGGTVTFAGSPGQGTTVTVVVPRSGRS